MKSWIIWIAIFLVGSAIYSAVTSADRNDSGSIVDSGTVSAFEIHVGDCLTDTFEGSSSTFSDANGVPCSQSHAYEAYHNESLSGETIPSNISTIADEICYNAFAGYVGTSIESTTLTYMALMPTQNSWDNNSDRLVTCLVGNADGSPVSGSLRNSGL